MSPPVPPDSTASWEASARRLGGLLLGMGLLFLVAEVLGALGIGHLPHRVFAVLLDQPFFASAIVGAVPLLLATRPSRKTLVWVVAGGLEFAAAWCVFLGEARLVPFLVFLGLFALGALTIGSFRGPIERRWESRARLFEALLLASVVPLLSFFLSLTFLLRPTTLDGALQAIEVSLGWAPEPALYRLFLRTPWLERLCGLVYSALPLVFPVITALRRDPPSGRQASPLGAFLWVAASGYVLYLLFPVVGPIHAFGAEHAQGAFPLEKLLATSTMAVESLEPRNCMPSLHTAWALIAFWYTRGLRPWVRGLFGAFLGLTLLATLGFGFHYTVDLVVALPFTLAVLALCTPLAPEAAHTRARVLVGSITAVVAWLLVLRFAPRLLCLSPLGTWTAFALTVAGTLWGEWRLARSPRATELVPEAGEESAREAVPGVQTWAIGAMFFLSGFAGLCYEVIFAKSLGLAFGSTSRASTLVLATYMGGIALGSWLGGRWGSRVSNPVRAYALVEAGIALWCALSPFLMEWAHALYVLVARGSPPSSTGLMPLQGLFALGLLLPPTLLMGISMPLLARHLTDARQSLGRAVGLLYGLNTLGAALGALLTGYALLPAFGVRLSTWIAVGLNLLVALVGLGLARGPRGVPAAAPAEEPVSAPSASSIPAGTLGRVGLVLLGVGGVVTFALETTYIHLLAVVAGNSAYAFSLMVFAFLVGLASGAALGRRWLASTRAVLERLALLELVLATVLLAGSFLWAAVPGYFASFGDHPPTRGFAAREFVRFVVCCLAMVPPAVLIGAIYPLAMECVGASRPGARVVAMGRAAALNTLGNIVGAILGGLVLVDVLGSLRTLQLLAVACLLLGAVPLLAARAWKAPVPLVTAALALELLALQPASLDLDALSSGANVYFQAQGWGRVIDHRESVEGGLTTIAESKDPDGTPVRTMLTNGKFQGDDSQHREMQAQVAFSLVPLLHVPERGHAAIIGLGTGVSARIASDAGFEHLDVVELSRDMVDMARAHFPSVNGGVLDRPQVKTHVTDGRNFLLLSARAYDFIGMEVSSIWFAGAANLYNREFYGTARRALSERGVLQQWVQLHRLSHEDILSVVSTLRAEFPRVWLYVVGNQGVLVACAWDCGPDAGTLARINQTPALQPFLTLIESRAEDLLQSRVLGPEDVDRMLANPTDSGRHLEARVSTDDNLLLEYRTPRGNVRPYDDSLRDNLAFLRRFSPPAPAADARSSMPEP